MEASSTLSEAAAQDVFDHCFIDVQDLGLLSPALNKSLTSIPI